MLEDRASRWAAPASVVTTASPVSGRPASDGAFVGAPGHLAPGATEDLLRREADHRAERPVGPDDRALGVQLDHPVDGGVQQQAVAGVGVGDLLGGLAQGRQGVLALAERALELPGRPEHGDLIHERAGPDRSEDDDGQDDALERRQADVPGHQGVDDQRARSDQRQGEQARAKPGDRARRTRGARVQSRLEDEDPGEREHRQGGRGLRSAERRGRPSELPSVGQGDGRHAESGGGDEEGEVDGRGAPQREHAVADHDQDGPGRDQGRQRQGPDATRARPLPRAGTRNTAVPVSVETSTMSEISSARSSRMCSRKSTVRAISATTSSRPVAPREELAGIGRGVQPPAGPDDRLEQDGGAEAGGDQPGSDPRVVSAGGNERHHRGHEGGQAEGQLARDVHQATLPEPGARKVTTTTATAAVPRARNRSRSTGSRAVGRTGVCASPGWGISSMPIGLGIGCGSGPLMGGAGSFGRGRYSIRWRRSASATAAVRSDAPSFSKMCSRCVLTVSGEMNSWPRCPCRRGRRRAAGRTSTSGGERSRLAVALLGLGELVGQGDHERRSMTMSPPATSRTAWIRCSASGRGRSPGFVAHGLDDELLVVVGGQHDRRRGRPGTADLARRPRGRSICQGMGRRAGRCPACRNAVLDEAEDLAEFDASSMTSMLSSISRYRRSPGVPGSGRQR